MALSAAGRADESGGVIGLNGPLVALLCVAYFVLIACALSTGRSDARAVRAEPRRDRELARRCERRSPATRRPDAEAPALVAYALTTMDHAARSRRLDETIGSIVLSLRGTERCTAIRAGRRDDPGAKCTSTRSSRPISVGADETAN